MAAPFKLGELTKAENARAGVLARQATAPAPAAPAPPLAKPAPPAPPKAGRPAGASSLRVPAGIQIESGIPVPPRTWGAGTACPFPFDRMKPGDSFFLAADQTAVSTRVSAWCKRLKLRATTRKVTEAGVHGTRVWLLERAGKQ